METSTVVATVTVVRTFPYWSVTVPGEKEKLREFSLREPAEWNLTRKVVEL